MFDFSFYQTLIVAVFVAAAAGFLGCFAILKRMALVSDALSHVALPGIALALIFNFNPFLGAGVFLFLAILGIWFLEIKTNLAVETIVGVFFAAALAIGTILTPSHELLEALLGDISALNFYEALIVVFLSVVLIGFLAFISKKLVLKMISEELAFAQELPTKKIEFLYLLSFALAVALGIKFVGALLMGSLVIIPAASAKNIVRSFSHFVILSIFFAVLSAFLGVLISSSFNILPGPSFILVASLIFLISLGFKIR